MSQRKRSRNYSFTINNYTDRTIEDMKALDFIRYCIVGEEVAPTTGTRHLQGYLQLHKPLAISNLVNKFKKLNLHPHFEVSRGNASQNIDYCSKDQKTTEWGECQHQGKRNDLIEMRDAVLAEASDLELAIQFPRAHARFYKWVDRLRTEIRNQQAKKAMAEKYKEDDLKQWQRKAVAKLDKQTDRKVLWIVDQEGGVGKSWLGKHLVAHRDAFYVRNGKSADIAHAYDYQRIVVFDFTRDQEERINYPMIEAFKDGMIFSPKYNSTTKMFEPAKVICLSNFDPDRSKLSGDRWDVMTIQKL